LSWSSFLGWETLKQGFDAYRAETAKTRADGRYVNDTVGVLVQGYCAETDATAKDEAGDGNLQWLRLAIDGYPRLAKLAKDYAYMAGSKEVKDGFSALDYLVGDPAGRSLGPPGRAAGRSDGFETSVRTEL